MRLSLLATLGLIIVAPAQDVPPTPPLTALRDAVGITRVGDRLLVTAWDHAAWLGRDGIRFEPVLGPRVPTLQYLHLQPIAVGRESQLWTLPAIGDRPLPKQSGDHLVCWQHGDRCRELATSSAAGVELHWQFDQAWPGNGDLVAQYRVDTTLPTTLRNGPNGALFAVPGLGGVAIGAVAGIDAAGERARGELRLQGSILELRLPAAFVDRARYPLVLDPLIGTEILVGGAADHDSQPDVAYDSTNDVFLVAFRRVLAANVANILTQRLSGSGALLGTSQTVSYPYSIAGHPTVANLAVRDTFVVAWERTYALFEPRRLEAIAVPANGAGNSNRIADVGSGAGEQIHPDAAGDNTTGDDEALVVYEDAGVGIKLALLTVSSTGTLTLQGTRTLSTEPTAADPVISKSPPSAGTYVAAWTDRAGGTPHVVARALDRNANIRSGLVSITGTTDLSHPDVDGNGTDFLLVYERREPGATRGERDVVCHQLRYDAATTSLTVAATRDLDARAGTDQKQPAVAFCRYKFVVAWADQLLAGALNYDLRIAELAANCTECGRRSLLTGLNGTPARNVEFWPAIASKYGGGAANDDALLLFAEGDDVPPFTSSVLAQSLDVLGPGGAIQQAGTGCGAPGAIGTSGGPFAVGNTDFAVTLAGLPVGSTPFLLLGFRGNEINCGSCTYVNPVAVEFVAPVGRNASYAYRVPCSSYALVGFTIQVQWLVYGTTYSPCPSLPGVSMTPRLWLPLVP